MKYYVKRKLSERNMKKRIIAFVLAAVLLSGFCLSAIADEKPSDNSIQAKNNEPTEEMFPIHVPQEGEYLYQAMASEHLNNLPEEEPVRITVHIDQMGYGREAIFGEESGLAEAIHTFLKIKVGPDDAPMVTDNYNWIRFEWEDGSDYMIRLNLYALEYTIDDKYHSYHLTDDKDFWELVYPNLQD